MKRILLIPALFLVLIGCGGPVVTFNQPQPKGIDSLTVIPRKLIGHYICKDGITSLTIDWERIILKYNYDVKQLRDSLDLGNMTTEERKKYRLEGDSVVEHIVDIDTIFSFSEDNVMKKYKGYYFLNSRYDKNSWYVQKLKLQKGLLTIGSISTKEELETLEKINESPIDTTTYQIDFTRKQFHDYIDNDGFSKTDTFIKMK